MVTLVFQRLTMEQNNVHYVWMVFVERRRFRFAFCHICIASKSPFIDVKILKVVFVFIGHISFLIGIAKLDFGFGCILAHVRLSIFRNGLTSLPKTMPDITTDNYIL